jgi:hypothetical protein
MQALVKYGRKKLNNIGTSVCFRPSEKMMENQGNN